MKKTAFCAIILAVYASGCSSDPLKHKISDKTIEALPGDKMADAKKILVDVETAKKALDVAKLKLKLTKMEFEMAQRYAEAASFAVKATRERLSLQNKGVPLTIPPGALDNAVKDEALSKKNLKYRRLMYELFEKRVALMFEKYHHLRASYYEKVVDVMHASGHKEAAKNAKSDFVRQAAERKILVATTMEQVEKGQATIKSLEAEVKPEWAPSLSCKSAKPAETTPPPTDGSGGTPTPPSK